MKLAAVVVTHNRLEKLRETVNRLLAEPLDHIVVLDNASSDGTSEWLTSLREPNLYVEYSDRNLGGTGGFAHGMARAMELANPDWIVVMDDDARPQHGAIEAFRRMDVSGWDAIGAAVVKPDRTVCEMNRPYRNPFWHYREFVRTLTGKGRQGFHIADEAYSEDAATIAIDMASFVGLFLSRDVILQHGYPDPRLFIYGDDQLYTLQMRRKGFRIGFAPQIRFEHDTVTAQTAGDVVLRPIWRVYYMYRNTLLAYRVLAGIWFWPLVPLLLVKWWEKAASYGSDEALYRLLLKLAVRDGLTRRLKREHGEVLQIAGFG